MKLVKFLKLVSEGVVVYWLVCLNSYGLNVLGLSFYVIVKSCYKVICYVIFLCGCSKEEKCDIFKDEEC